LHQTLICFVFADGLIKLRSVCCLLLYA